MNKKVVKKSVKKSLEKKSHIKPKRTSSGIKNLDKFTKGGFEGNSVNLLVGGSGSGKSIFAIQFLIDGMKKGEKCLHISFEEQKEEFYENVKGLGWDLEKYEKQGKFFFLEYTPEKVRTMLEEGGGEIESTVLNQKISRMAVDSITSFTLLFEKEHERRKASLSLFNLLRKWDCTVLLTYERDPLVDKKRASRILEIESDSITMLYNLRDQKKRNRYLEIIKMRGTDHTKEVYPYEIKKNGITISAKPYKGKIEIV